MPEAPALPSPPPSFPPLPHPRVPGHYHKDEYYVPKGKADGFSGMFVAKETGEML